MGNKVDFFIDTDRLFHARFFFTTQIQEPLLDPMLYG